MEKTFKSYDELLLFMQAQKNLVIDDPAYAKHILSKTSYFSLISGYKTHFKNPTTKQYKDGTTFEDIYTLYRFDNELRSVFLKYMLIAERSVKSSLAYHFTSLYEDNQNEYLAPSHYAITPKNQRDVSKLLNILSYHITHKSDYSYITHYKKYYQNVPLWIMIQVLTVGQLSHMFDFLNARVPIRVCQDHHNITRNDMHSFLSVLTKHRNVCAHGDRFFNYVTKDSITDTSIHKKLHIVQINGRYKYGKTDLFSEVIILKYLLDEEDFTNFFYELKDCLKNKYPHSEILTIIGFPENWTDILYLNP